MRKMDAFGDGRLLIVGGSDSALHWTLNLISIANCVTQTHRRDQFGAAPYSVDKMTARVADKMVGLRAGSADRTGDGGLAV